MKFEIHNGEYLGTAEWLAPGQVRLEMADGKHRQWFERFFSAEDAQLGGSVECPEMTLERRDDSAEAFERAVFGLTAYDCTVSRADQHPTAERRSA
ncbi:MAG TPA: hypothetical protein VHJ82_07475 [Actinomycetota bacterium]|nr:hypothetical protein [Actinomycetota bacterium]